MVDDGRAEQELPPLDTPAARLGYLFDKIRPTPAELSDSDGSGRRYTNREIAGKITEVATETGVTISARDARR